ncbi:interferon-induced very large GTPase 1-like isoform X2 [Dendropsophus ebraccatus]|uniref:interferon-induced very large GTPase 1-like isoform X2 n=1 Tax=Dendropsophus ebraccatus TaxID=150705 RepID=UPI0038313F1B
MAGRQAWFQNWKMSEVGLGLLIVLCIVPKVNTQEPAHSGDRGHWFLLAALLLVILLGVILCVLGRKLWKRIKKEEIRFLPASPPKYISLKTDPKPECSCEILQGEGIRRRQQRHMDANGDGQPQDQHEGEQVHNQDQDGAVDGKRKYKDRKEATDPRKVSKREGDEPQVSSTSSRGTTRYFALPSEEIINSKTRNIEVYPEEDHDPQLGKRQYKEEAAVPRKVSRSEELDEPQVSRKSSRETRRDDALPSGKRQYKEEAAVPRKVSRSEEPDEPQVSRKSSRETRRDDALPSEEIINSKTRNIEVYPEEDHDPQLGKRQYKEGAAVPRKVSRSEELDEPQVSRKSSRETRRDDALPSGKRQYKEEATVPRKVSRSEELDEPKVSRKSSRENRRDDALPSEEIINSKTRNIEVYPEEDHDPQLGKRQYKEEEAVPRKVSRSEEPDEPQVSRKSSRETRRDDALPSEEIINSKTRNIEVYPEEDHDPQLELLQKLMALDTSARKTIQDEEFEITYWDSDDDDDDDEEEEFRKKDTKSTKPSNPLDVLCGLLNCSDMIRQQQIVYKMSMCQFAVPLLLPSLDRRDFTFMLWSMRDIVKRWKPQCLIPSKDYKEDSIVNVPMPVFSFVRLGSCNISKSRYLNQVLSPPQQNHNFFVHGDMPGGNIPRKLSEGLVEICWYLPTGNGQSDVFPEPIAVTNLRGDLKSNKEQFSFLRSLSSGMFIFIEDINEHHRSLVSSLQKEANVFFILNVKDGDVNTENLKSLTEVLPRNNLLVKNKRVNDSQMVKKIRTAMKRMFSETKDTRSLEEISKKVTEPNIHIDENSPKCQEIKGKAKEITDEINDINQYKKETMKLQGEFWKQMSRTEKEMCRMRELGDRDAEEYKSELRAKIEQLQEVQRQQSLTYGMERFREAITMYSVSERKLFLKWLKIFLDTKGRNHLRNFQNEYKRKYTQLSATEQDLQEIDQKIADGSLGVEHFIRELGQFYEIQSKSKNKLIDLPRKAADLLLDGFPLELIDGDASNIPLQWITDVLTELDEKTGGQCRMRVITVLGVQSTGKSTLLNTMFGLQFPVASGRCTRGAFMTLIDAKNFQEELNCDYILVIDTEGLKSLELVSLENSYEHDNELATVVVGLSDITIVNMAMENAEEMKDILQIVVHAFLRMKEIGKKSSCHFVHQNVSDVSAHVKNRNARQKFLEQLSEMAKVAARMEKRSGINHFSDIIYCDIDKDSWYVPGLWYGIPPMASVNTGYSEIVSDLRQSILRSLQSMAGKPQNIREFTEWIKSLWNAVKHEKFVFSFRNRLVTEAYNQLCIQYADWEWTFQKNVHRWMIETETFIYNLTYEKISADLWNKLKNYMNQILDKEERAMNLTLEEYFESDVENAHLLEMFRGDFIRSVKYLRKQLENVLYDKCEKTICIQRDKSQIQAIQAQYIDIMEEKIAEVMERTRNTEYMLNNDALKIEFVTMWDTTVSTLTLSKIERRHVGHEILPQLKKDIDCEDSVIMEWFHNLNVYKESRFELKNKHLSGYSSDDAKRLSDLTTSLIDKCKRYVEDVTSKKDDFNTLYSQELLSLINKALGGRDFQDLHINKLFVLDLKLHVLGSATIRFQKMHEDFVQRNDPRTCLERLKPQYFSIFRSIYEQRDDCRRKAEQFCKFCLQPAITDHINKHLGKEMMDDILLTNDPEEFKSRKRLQLVILEKLLKDKSWEQYIKYINDYESFLKRWISAYITEHYKERIRVLQEKILHFVMAKVRETLNHPAPISSGNLNEFLGMFCDILDKELVISKNNMKAVLFQSKVNVKQFVKDVDLHLSYLQNEIQQQMNLMSIESILSRLTLKPQEELFKKAIGCGKRCPFCKAPCEAGGADHKEHFTSLHRPRGLGQHKDEQTNVLDHSICSTNVISNKRFTNEDTAWKPHPYKDYRTYYPDWAICPDMAANASDYWKFVFKEFNHFFAQIYNAKPAKIPEDWDRITPHQALTNLRTT